MVSFSCEGCGDVLTKKKLDPHRGQCRTASYTCLDCMVHFQGFEYRSHTSCVSEAQKYQGNMYKEKKNGKSPRQPQSQALVPRPAYVEEETRQTTAVAIVDAPPHAPSPPPNVNVFDFLLPAGTTVNGDDEEVWESEDEEMQLERELARVNPEDFLVQDEYDSDGYAYGNGPVKVTYERYESFGNPQNSEFVTPANPKGHSRNISLDSTGQKKSDKKRKRGHVEELDLSKSRLENGDIVMTDVPTALHSGLTGGLNRMLTRPDFPPSPDLSSGDANGRSPQSPIKRTRREKESKDKDIRREKKVKRKADHEKDDPAKRNSKDKLRPRDESSNKREKTSHHGRWEVRRSRRRSASPVNGTNGEVRVPSPNNAAKSGRPALKAIEYHGQSSDAQPSADNALVKAGSNALVEHNPTTQSVDTFLACLVKGSETDEGVSVWKALKRWRRDGGSGEKELWKGLKIRANEHGELVLCV